MGIPEKTVYRIGVFIFYILLFFAIILVTKKVQLPQDEPYKNSLQESKPWEFKSPSCAISGLKPLSSA